MKFQSPQNTYKLLMLFTAMLFGAALGASGYSFMPLVTSYASQEPLCATQAWSATQDENGVLYFATSNGVLIFDGVHWESIAIDGIMTVRSVKAIGDRIYVGSYEQLGYLERDEFGQAIFHSMKNQIKDYEFRDDEFWSIVPFDDEIYFQSFRSIFKVKGNLISTFQEEGTSPLYLFNIDGRLYSQLIWKGLYEVEGENFTEILPREKYGDSNIVAMLGNSDGSFTLFTEEKGLYSFSLKNRLVKQFVTAIDKELKTHIINRVCKMSDGTIAIGTIRNGVYAINPDGSLKWHYNLDNGLGNNSVLGLTEDSTGNLWVMMDHGISVIHSGLPYSFLMPHAGEPYIGMTYDMYRDGDKLYIGTNQGLYTYSYTDKKIYSSIGQSQIWHIDAFDSQILIGGGTLSMHIMPDSKTVSSSKSSTDIKKGIIHNKEALVESSYYSLRIYLRDENGIWRYSHDIEDFGAPIRQIEIDNDGSIWCAHTAQGVLHIELSTDLKRIEKIDKIRTASDDRLRSTSFVMKLRGQIVISDGDSLYQYDSRDSGLHAMAGFHNDLPTVKEIYSTTSVDDKRFWLSTRKSYILISYKDGHYSRELTIPLDYLSLQSNGVNNKVHVDKANNCYFAINNGVGCVALDRLSAQPSKATMSIAKIENVVHDGIVNLLKLKSDSETPAETSGNIRINLNYPSYNFTSPRFVYSLEGAENMISTSEKPSISFVGLKHGNYKFRAAMIDDHGNALATADYDFVVPTPAYLTYWAMSGYLIALIALIIAISRLYSRRQVNRQRRDHEIERVAQNIKILEQERIISEQQKQLLQNELNEKSKELASMALEAGYKHQVIENLRETISVQRRKGMIESKEIDTLIKTINSDIDKKEFWDIFQNNFDLIHENFFRNLRKQFPELTPIDMKFCALLRLNMSTKDIAKFTHLTIRGVETARYRLRRKLGLESKDSIVQFLIDFK